MGVFHGKNTHEDGILRWMFLWFLCHKISVSENFFALLYIHCPPNLWIHILPCGLLNVWLQNPCWWWVGEKGMKVLSIWTLLWESLDWIGLCSRRKSIEHSCCLIFCSVCLGSGGGKEGKLTAHQSSSCWKCSAYVSFSAFRSQVIPSSGRPDLLLLVSGQQDGFYLQRSPSALSHSGSSHGKDRRRIHLPCSELFSHGRLLDHFHRRNGIAGPR